MNWKQIYPTVAAAQGANFETVCAWCDNLPQPQTDVERAVMRRLQARREQLGRAEVRRLAPGLADQLNSIIDGMERLGIKSPVKRY